MANLIQRKVDKEKALKIELPDGTAGSIPIEDDAPKLELMDASNLSDDFYKHGGKVKPSKSSNATSSNAHSAIDKLMKSSK